MKRSFVLGVCCGVTLSFALLAALLAFANYDTTAPWLAPEPLTRL